MKINKLVKRCMAGLLCTALVAGSGLPQKVLAADENQDVQTQEAIEHVSDANAVETTEQAASTEETSAQPEVAAVQQDAEINTEAVAVPETAVENTVAVPETYQHEYTYSDSELTAKAVIKTKGILPEDAQLVVKKIVEIDDAQFQTIINVNKFVQEKGVRAKERTTYDISFIKDGVEIEPTNGDVEVSLSFANAITYKGDGDYILLHEKEDGSIEDVSGQVATTTDGAVEQVDFSASEFSKFTFARTGSPDPSITSLMQVESKESNTDNLVLDKTASYDKDSNTATISLEAYAKGEITLSQVTKPMDIVLVLDTSSSMIYPENNMKDENGNFVSRLDALKTSVKEFVKSLYEDQNASTVGHRISIVLFGQYTNEYGGIIDLKNTTLEAVNTLIDQIQAAGETPTDEGLAKGQIQLDKLRQESKKDNRSEMMILFTDGEPNYMADAVGMVGPDETEKYGHALFYKVGNAAIANALNIKKEGVPLYTIGVSEKADASTEAAAFDYPFNRFLQAVSSNYPNAAAIDKASMGARSSKDAYYQTAADVAALKQAFENILVAEGSTNVTLDSSALLLDTISDVFQAPNADTDIKVYTQKYNGPTTDASGAWGTKELLKDAAVTVDHTTKQVSVTGFDYKKNYVAYTEESGEAIATGQKLVVEIKVKVNEDFIGGNDVLTNGEAYIKSGDSKVKDFPAPTVDVPLRYNFDTTDQGIYITNNLDHAEQLFNVTKDGVSFTNKNGSYILDTVNNAYVNITYTVQDKTNVVGTYTVNAGEKTGTWNNGMAPDFSNLTADQKYTVTATVTPNVSGSVAASNKEGNATVHVFTPTIKVNDSVLFYGAEADLSENIAQDDIQWKCSDKNHKVEAPKDGAPELSYVLQQKDGTAIENLALGKDTSKDTQVKITSVIANEKDIISNTVIKNESETHDKDAKDYNFTVFVVKGQLDITKKIDKQYTNVKVQNANESFIFKIERRDTLDGEVVETFYTTVQFDANQTTTEKTESIAGLKKGYYTVTEETAWTPKYKLTGTTNNYSGNGDAKNIYIGDTDKVTAQDNGKANIYGTAQSDSYEKFANAYPAAATFTNHLNTSFQWLSDAAAAVNKFVN